MIPSQAPRTQQYKASFTKDEAIRADSINPETSPEFMDAGFSARLKQMGVAQPNPTYSPSSTAKPFPFSGPSSHQFPPTPNYPNYPSAANNTTLGVLEARRRLEEQAELEFENIGKSTDKGREFLDVGTIRKILVLRQQGEDPSKIEGKLKLKSGVVKRLGRPGIVAAVVDTAT